MCGIIGIVSNKPVAESIVDGLRRLEYRGYDSAGIAVLEDGQFLRARAEGKLRNLENRLREKERETGIPIDGTIGIGHTRWATHGAPSHINAHPHMTDQVAVVHNGIIENFAQLRDELAELGHGFKSETDTEVVPVLLTHYLCEGMSPKEAFQTMLGRLEGAFALGALFRDEPDTLYAARRGSPQAIGYGDGEMIMASDAYALAPLTNRVCYLEEGDWAIIGTHGADIFDAENKPVHRPIVTSQLSGATVGKGNFRHFMLKEIFEQPTVIGETLGAYFDPVKQRFDLPDLPVAMDGISRITIIACGTSYYAGMVAKYWLERYCRIPVDVDIASEYRYRYPVHDEKGLFIAISQSGETADTLAALRHAKEAGQTTLAIVNVPESSMARESDAMLRTYAGPEIGVASTKAFTAQLVTLACLTLALADARQTLREDERQQLGFALSELPAKASEVLSQTESIAALAPELSHAPSMLYMGRGVSFPIAQEGALKLKEISYIHAEAYAAGELKHGPIALIDEEMPIVVIAPPDELFEKTASNLQEVVARGGKALLISASEQIESQKNYIHQSIKVPTCHSFVAPILYALPIQLLAYEVATFKGTDVDQPRNLAKSVTVE